MFSEISVSQLDTAPSQQTVFGEPLEAHGKTLIPVSKLAGNPCLKGVFKRLSTAKNPLGFLEISRNKTRYIRAHDRQKVWWVLSLTLVSLLLLLMGLRIRKEQRAKRLSLW